ncbi:SGNH/GDSL hydrolase family protein [Nocardioides anomalus]|uniref:SGNH/GDSL hydrolase family protein n=1 Tax=Nocardioides anomalus TaxID=2712223 RepID=A0A6G6WHH6_9ACTN|nr:SGNH/GDSL hydrolase family protein [Nocardioides anomalus]QIG44694.1 SGNH/GDSL hydrolase family protein [Nocardioides anomalus]
MRRALVPVLTTLLLLLGVPAVHAAPDPAAPAVAKASKRALWFGDSYFVGGGCSPDEFRGMAANASYELGYDPVIRGAGGTGFVAANPEYGIPPYLAQIRQGAFDVGDVDLVVVEGGSNDIGRSLSKIRRNTKRVLLIAKKRFPGTPIIVVGPMQTYGPWSDTDGIRDAMKAVSRKLGLRFVNDQKWTAGHDDWLCSDYVHPTYAGHQQLGHRLAQALAKRGA